MSNTKTSETSISPNNSVSSKKATIQSVRSEYERADCFCAEVQSFSGKAGIPAMNELRNAGKHLFEALDNSGALVDNSQLQSAFGHCRRAAYEAYEAGILTSLEIIRKFKTDYRDVVISQAVPDYADILVTAGEAQKAVEDGRKKEFDRTGDHTARMEAFRELRKLCERLELCRDEANKLVSDRIDGLQKHARTMALTYLGVALAVVGVIFGLPGFLSWLASEEVQTPQTQEAPKIDNKPPEVAFF